MPIRRRYQNTYFHGDHNSLCERCRFKYKASELLEEWTGLRVCPSCYEPRHPSLDPIAPVGDISIVDNVITEPAYDDWWLWGDGEIIVWGDGEVVAS